MTNLLLDPFQEVLALFIKNCASQMLSYAGTATVRVICPLLSQ